MILKHQMQSLLCVWWFHQWYMRMDDDDDDDDDEVVVGVDCRTLVPEAAMQGYYNSMPP
jgi:hypothetical protein